MPSLVSPVNNKRIISLDFVVWFIGGFSFLIGFDQWRTYNFLIFFGLSLTYFWLDYKIYNTADSAGYLKAKKIFVFSAIGLILSLTVLTSATARVSGNGFAPVHDNVQQVEAALKFITAGQNPYTENYFGTEMDKSAYITVAGGQIMVNPAMYHYIKLPWHLLGSLPTYWFFHWFYGFYDERFTYFILFFISLLALFSLPQKTKAKFLLVVAYTFNPLFLPFFAAGRDDVFVLSWLIFALYFLKYKRSLAASLMLALAAASKHSAWFFVPFFYGYLYYQTAGANFWAKAKTLVKTTWLFPAAFLALMLPFVIWDPISFYQDIYAYPAGTLATSYPINGVGLSMFLYQLGAVGKITDYLPLVWLQIPLTLLGYYFLIRKQKSQNTIAYALAAYGLLMLVYWLLARFFHDNYVGFISQIFLLAYCLQPNGGETEVKSADNAIQNP